MITESSAALPNRLFYSLVALGVILNALGLGSYILEPDGALYATIAKTMAQSGDFVNLYVEGYDWLDKPHFPFWITAISYNLFGINSFAYKLPGILFFGIGVWYTYRFAQLAYSRLVAQVTTLILLTTMHLIMSNNDVRAEPFLLGQIIGSVFHFYRMFLRAKTSLTDLLAGSFWAGCALMTKGPFVLVPIGAGLVIHFFLTGNWKELLKWRWYAAIVLTIAFTLPELYTLYQQFDLHPEKIVFGKTGVSGIRFFFWDSQFGRFFNTGPIKGQGDKLFFVHTLLWAFLPWSLLLYASVGKVITGLVRRQNPLPEYVSFGSGLMTFLLFSLSGFQLPHYMNIVFPFFAVLTAHYLTGLRSELVLRRWLWVQTGIAVLLAVVAVALLFVFRPSQLTGAAIWIGVFLLFIFVVFRTSAISPVWGHTSLLSTVVGRTVGASLLTFGFYNLFFLPDLLPYQAGGEAAFYLNQTGPKNQPVGMYRDNSYSFEFYLDQPVHYWRNPDTLQTAASRQPVIVFTRPERLDSLQQQGWTVKQLKSFSYFHVSQLKGSFLDHETRASAVEPFVVAEVRK